MKHTTNHFVLIFVMSFTCSAQAMVARLGQMAAAQRAAMSGASKVLAGNNAFTQRALPMAQQVRHYSQKSDDEKQKQHYSLDELRKRRSLDELSKQTANVALCESRYQQEKLSFSRQMDGCAVVVATLGAFSGAFPVDNLGAFSFAFSVISTRFIMYRIESSLILPFFQEAKDLKEARAVLDAQMKKLQQESKKGLTEESEIKTVA